MLQHYATKLGTFEPQIWQQQLFLHIIPHYAKTGKAQEPYKLVFNKMQEFN